MAGVRLIQFCGPQGQQGSYDWPIGAV